MDSLELNWLALHLIPNIGVKTLQKLLQDFGSTEEILEASFEELVQKSKLSETLAKRITTAKSVTSFHIEQRLISQTKTELWCLESSPYPKNLKEISAAPPVLYKQGALQEIKGLCISFVGSRSSTAYGKKQTERLIIELAELAPSAIIISGLARGIDTVAHQTALKVGLPTIAILAGGLTNIYPPENQELAEQIKNTGALLSEFPMGLKPIARNFPIRNRVISGLSQGIVVTEAGLKSGALITAAFGLQHNREVFALPGRVDIPTSRGTNRLISRQHAKLIVDARDIIDELQLESETIQTQFDFGPTDPQTIDRRSLSENQVSILKALGSETQDLDTIYNQTNIKINELLGLLVELELMGYVQTLAGQHYRIEDGYQI